MDVSRRSEDTSRTAARSPGGGILVRTTDRGLPTAIKLDQRELAKSPTQLAQEILLLCQLSAMRMQVAQRQDLFARGFSTDVVRSLDLCSEEELAQAELALRGDDSDEPPGTWMVRV
jgi:hypothetical protein